MRSLRILIAVCAMGVAHSALAGEPIDVTVNNSSLGNPIGAGFGWWEGAEPLLINLWADPGEITSANTYLPEEVIWHPTDNTRPDPWTFETAAILPDKAFAVMFKGTLTTGGGPGGPGGSPSEWAAAVSDVDIDCDSDNDAIETGRPPSGSDEEDAVEFVDGSSSTTPYGMVLGSAEGWAQLRISGNLRRSGVVTIEIGGDISAFLIAEYVGGDYVVCEPIPNPAYPPEAGSVAVYEERDVPAGSYSKMLYVRPSGAGEDDDQVVAGAFFSPPPATQGTRPATQTAEDKVSVTQKEWTLDAPTRVVMVEADNNYSDPGANDPPYNPAKMKKMTVRGPANQPFVLKRLYPQGESSKLRVYKADKTTEVTWAGDVSEDLTVGANGVTEFWVKGLAGTIQNADTKASSNFNDQQIELWTGTQQAPVAKQAASEWTALWVKLELETQGNIPNDNNAQGFYKEASGTIALGAIGDGAGVVVVQGQNVSVGNYYGIRYGVQLKGTVFPQDTPSTIFVFKRRTLGSRVYRDSTVLAGRPNMDDGPYAQNVDNNPTSDGSNGKIYSLDGPGLPGLLFGWQLLSGYPQNAIVACRGNFVEWVELNDERCAEKYPWFYRRAAQKAAAGLQGAWNAVNLGQGDNTAGRGATNLTWDLGQGVMSVSLTVAPSEYAPNNLNATFTANVAGGTANFTYAWTFVGAPAPAQVQAGPKAAQNDAQTKALAANVQNTGKHTAIVVVTDSAQNPNRDSVSIDVFTNKPPIPVATGTLAGGQLTLSGVGTQDPENQRIEHLWMITYYNAADQAIGATNPFESTIARPFVVNAPPNTSYVRVTLACQDIFEAEAQDIITVR